MPETIQNSVIQSSLLYSLTRNFPNPDLQAEEAVNDSNKPITVKLNEIWEILWIWIEFAATATVGNRQVQLDILDESDDVVLSVLAANVQIASTTEYYLISPNGQEPKETVAGRHFIPIPPKLFLPQSYDIKIYDSAAIAAAADDMVVQMMVNRFDTD